MNSVHKFKNWLAPADRLFAFVTQSDLGVPNWRPGGVCAVCEPGQGGRVLDCAPRSGPIQAVPRFDGRQSTDLAQQTVPTRLGVAPLLRQQLPVSGCYLHFGTPSLFQFRSFSHNGHTY